MNKLEIKLKGSSVNIWKLMMVFFISLTISLILSHIIFPHMLFTRLLLAGCVMIVLMQLTFYFFQFDVKITAEDGNLIIYKNSDKVIDTQISNIILYETADIYHKRMVSELRIFFTNKKEFYFSIFAVSIGRNGWNENIEKLVKFLTEFNEEYSFKQEPHMTKLGPSKNLRNYVNQKLAS